MSKSEYSVVKISPDARHIYEARNNTNQVVNFSIASTRMQKSTSSDCQFQRGSQAYGLVTEG